MHFWAVHATVCTSSLFLSVTEQYFIIWMDHSLASFSPVDEYLGRFQFLLRMNKATLNICIQSFV